MNRNIHKIDPLHLLLATYIDRIIAQLRRFESIDLSAHDLPIRFTYLNGRDKKGRLNCYAIEYFVDKVSYIDDVSFAIDATGMTDDPDKYTEETIEAANIERAPGTEQRFVVNRQTLSTDRPYLFPLGIFEIMRLVERAAELLDGERTADDMLPFEKDESEIMRFMLDLDQAFEPSDEDKSHRQNPFLKSNWLS